MMVQSILVNRLNFLEVKESIKERVSKADLLGIDIETGNDNSALPSKKKLDTRRVIVTGLSLYPNDGNDLAYYFDLNHAIPSERLTWLEVREVLDCKKPEAYWVAHNAVYEVTNLICAYDYDLRPNIFCSMQACITAYGPDNYDISKFLATPLNNINCLVPEIIKHFSPEDAGKSERELTTAQADIFWKFAGKATTASHSYNGFVDSIKYGYSLKKVVKTFFGVEMVTYKEVLGKHNSMTKLTGAEVVSYGADDAYWCIKVFETAANLIATTNDKLTDTFINQENPLVSVFSDIHLGGVRINKEEITSRLAAEQIKAAAYIITIKEELAKLLPFPTEPCEPLMADRIYRSGFAKYRRDIINFVNSDLNSSMSTEEIVSRTAGGVANSLELVEDISEELLSRVGINLNYYVTTRAIIYDLFKEKPIKCKGKVTSDKDARGTLLARIEKNEGKDSAKYKILVALRELGHIDQSCKLYLLPYLKMMDPDTGRLYPEISAMLATRRMSMNSPNSQQMAKRGDLVYIRGFIKPDYEDHVIMSADWSSIEIVIPAEMSKDPELVRCFSTIPYDDVHAIAAETMLNLEDKDLSIIKHLPEGTKQYKDTLLVNREGTQLSPGKFVKWVRTDYGKAANFNYWYSGALGTVAEKLGLTSEEMWEKVELYRRKFSVAEAWRVATIDFVSSRGYVELPDGHRRYRLEATDMWRNAMSDKFKAFGYPGMEAFGSIFIRFWNRRAKNQGVNALIQGTSATLTKRSMLKLRQVLKERGWTSREARIIFPVHDEITASVHRDKAVEYNKLIREVMNNHPELFKTCKPYATVSMGRTFQPFDFKGGILTGQIELDEAPDCLPHIKPEHYDGVMDDDEIRDTVKYLFGEL